VEATLEERATYLPWDLKEVTAFKEKRRKDSLRRRKPFLEKETTYCVPERRTLSQNYWTREGKEGRLEDHAFFMSV